MSFFVSSNLLKTVTSKHFVYVSFCIYINFTNKSINMYNQSSIKRIELVTQQEVFPICCCCTYIKKNRQAIVKGSRWKCFARLLAMSMMLILICFSYFVNVLHQLKHISHYFLCMDFIPIHLTTVAKIVHRNKSDKRIAHVG